MVSLREYLRVDENVQLFNIGDTVEYTADGGGIIVADIYDNIGEMIEVTNMRRIDGTSLETDFNGNIKVKLDVLRKHNSQNKQKYNAN